MDKAALIGYDGANMPFIFFKNRTYALMDSYPFEGVRLTLLQAACAGTAAQTIANLTSDTPGLSEKDRIEMSLERLWRPDPGGDGARNAPLCIYCSLSGKD